MTVVSTSYPIDIPTYSQISTIISQLVVDYGNMAQTFYDMFYNPEPLDVTLTLYDGAGVLKTYVIPNRAKDFNYCRNGQGSPEGIVTAVKGTIYQDTLNGDLYIKKTATDSNGWELINTDNVVEKGYEAPEGRLSRPKGFLYVDANTASLYIKSTSSGSVGWDLISANTTSVANVDLSNLTTEGYNRFANTDLSNISNIGANAFANGSLNNLNSAGEKHFLNKGQASNVILEDYGGVQGTVGNNYVTVPAGFKALLSDGRASDGTLKNKEYTLPSNLVGHLPNSFSGRHAIFLTNSPEVTFCPKERYFVGPNPPTAFATYHANYAVWFDLRNNLMKITSDGGTTWSEFWGVYIGDIDILTVSGEDYGQIISISPERATKFLSLSDSDYISSCGTPSSYNIHLTPDISGSSVIAPMDGYFVFSIDTGDSAKVCEGLYMTCLTLAQGTNYTKLYQTAHSENVANAGLTLPVAKGDLFRYIYVISNSHDYPLTYKLDFLPNKGEVDIMA